MRNMKIAITIITLFHSIFCLFLLVIDTKYNNNIKTPLKYTKSKKYENQWELVLQWENIKKKNRLNVKKKRVRINLGRKILVNKKKKPKNLNLNQLE